MQKNTASQKLTLLAIDTVNNVPKTGDAGQLTAYVSIDDGSVTVLGDTSATELDATNAPGLYSFDLTQGETNGNKLVFSGKSSTTGIRLVPLLAYATPANFAAESIDSNGRVDVIKVAGTTQTARDLGASVLLSSGTGTGQVSLSSGAVLLQATQTGVTIPTVTTLTNAPPDSSGVTTLLARIGAFTGSGVNTVLGFFKALLSKTASTPSDVGGTFDPTTDSTEALADNAGGGSLTAAGVRSAVGLAAANLDTQLSGIQADTDDIQTRLPAALVGGRMDSSTGAMASGVLTATAIASNAITAAKVATDAIGAAQVAADAVAEIQTGLSTLNAAGVRTAVGLASANLDTQLSSVQSDVTSIKGHPDRTVIRGTVSATAPTTTSFTCSALSPAGVAADQFKGRILVFDNATTTTALRGQATDITASSAAGLPLLTFTALTTAPVATDSFSIV